MLRFDRKRHNSVKQLSFNKKINLKKEKIKAKLLKKRKKERNSVLQKAKKKKKTRNYRLKLSNRTVSDKKNTLGLSCSI